MPLAMPKPQMPLSLRYTSVVSLFGLLFALDPCRRCPENARAQMGKDLKCFFAHRSQTRAAGLENGEGQGSPNGMPCPSLFCACRGQICTSASRNLSHMRTNRSASSGPIVSMTAWARASGRWWTARKSGSRCVTIRRDRARPFRSFTT